MPRAEKFDTISGFLSRLGDREVAELVATATPLGAGIGGTTSLLRIGDVPVFLKKIRLTDLEMAHPRSTANLYDVPAYMQYGANAIGSTAINAWREVATHEMTTEWVLSRAYDGFPLTYHWRVLPETLAIYEELADVEKVVAYWGGSQAVRRRLLALHDSSAVAVLFCEYIPQSLESCDDAPKRQLLDGVAFMNSHELLHFDPHFGNLLTDGERIYFADFGLATSTRFELSPAEREFFQTHRTYDHAYVLSYVDRWQIYKKHDIAWRDHLAFLREHGGSALTLLMTEFFDTLINESRTTPYPVAEIEKLLSEQ
ncbi:protein kinase family protein [Fodinicola acaciae]|uniref:protein kinase family protein n=1 Tax=Fodinicola acaciae TaxID=2681555 RepID=UPI001C9E2A6E|nr:protein kinase family protein [Fodinicola acaciae]